MSRQESKPSLSVPALEVTLGVEGKSVAIVGSKSLAPKADPANTASDRSSSLSHKPEAQFL